MEQYIVETDCQQRKDKWYNLERFPLVPKLSKDAATEYSTSGFSFRWLFFKIWSRDAFDFEIAFTIDPTHWGIGFTALLPYLRVVVCVPFPVKIGIWFQRNTWRTAKGYSHD
jgi:hypothetical protein